MSFLTAIAYNAIGFGWFSMGQLAASWPFFYGYFVGIWFGERSRQPPRQTLFFPISEIFHHRDTEDTEKFLRREEKLLFFIVLLTNLLLCGICLASL
ncbi:hypothetical protein CKA32_004125 [Geitlerinema sp. FC II]|nr:hypothetical protein CKA32_004125 [Geitlerinema sp. FC II]